MTVSRSIHVAVNVIISLKSTATVERVFLIIKGPVNKEQARQHRKIKNTHPHLLTSALSTVRLRSRDLEEVKQGSHDGPVTRSSGHLNPPPCVGTFPSKDSVSGKPWTSCLLWPFQLPFTLYESVLLPLLFGTSL